MELEPHFAAEAKKRQAAAGSRGAEGGRGHNKKTVVENVPQGFKPAPKSRDQAAADVGVSGKRKKKPATPHEAKSQASGAIGLPDDATACRTCQAAVTPRASRRCRFTTWTHRDGAGDRHEHATRYYRGMVRHVPAIDAALLLTTCTG